MVIGLSLRVGIGSGSGIYLSWTGGRLALRKLGASVDSVLDAVEDIFLVSRRLLGGLEGFKRLFVVDFSFKNDWRLSMGVQSIDDGVVRRKSSSLIASHVF